MSADIEKLLAAGAIPAAMTAVQKALMQQPHNPVLHMHHARARSLNGEYKAAADAQQIAVQQGGAEVSRVLLLGEYLMKANELQPAANVFQQVIRQQKNNATAWLGLGHCLLLSSDFQRAARCYQGVLEIEPNHSVAKSKIALCYFRQGDALRALQLLDQITDQGDSTPEIAYFRAECLRFSSRFEEAEMAFASLADDTEWGGRAKRALVSIGFSLGHFVQAEAMLLTLLEDAPNDAELLSYKVKALMISGDADAAMALALSMMRAGEPNPVLWEMYADHMKMPFSVELLPLLFGLKERKKKVLERRGVAKCCFALARHYALAGDYEAEVVALAEGNDLLAALEPFDVAQETESMETLRACYDQAKIASLSHGLPACEFAPVFILCPPRSGSTLLETALARHADCEAGGERGFADWAWHEVTGEKGVAASDIVAHENLSQKQLLAFRDTYLAWVCEAGLSTKKVMIHKGINGHKFAGLLKAAFPQARFIELVRDPFDVAFGCYRQNFESQPLTRTFAGCASVVRSFQENMDWWREQFPCSLYRQTYQGLVDDFEGSLRALCEWIGLPWDEGCLDFNRVAKIGTASMGQVRGGINRDGLSRYQSYGSLLQDLDLALHEAGVER
ncbi:MAG: sulfotransferase [Alloalcanivorax sp.]